MAAAGMTCPRCDGHTIQQQRAIGRKGVDSNGSWSGVAVHIGEREVIQAQVVRNVLDGGSIDVRTLRQIVDRRDVDGDGRGDRTIGTISGCS